MTAPPFVVFSMPRSRSAWMARFLTWGDWHCGHEELLYARSLDDVGAWFSQPCTGTVETAAAPFWRLLGRFGDVRVVVVRRPVDEVVASFLRLPMAFDEAMLFTLMRGLDRKLAQIERRVPGALSVSFADLATEDGCRRVWEHVMPYPWQPDWWAAASRVNIQIDMRVLARRLRAYQPQLMKLAKQARHRTIAMMAASRGNGEFDGVTFQVEPFARFYRDAEPLFREHLTQVGESPDDHARKNLSLLQMLDDTGGLQCLTARVNGRMFGYLMTVIGPSLESPDDLRGEHTTFFASPAIRGLGMRLQRAALEKLRERGVGEVIMWAGQRGSGPRLGTFYRRLGAEDFGHLYKLNLELN
jgi:GNAT superfamily N-acetyltransferase